MATLRSPRKKLGQSEYETTPVSLRLRKTQRSFLNEKKRKSPLYSEQKYLRKLIDLGIKAVERGDEYEDDKKGIFNPKSATSITTLKNEITKEVIEHIRASTKHSQDVTGIQLDELARQLTATKASLNDQYKEIQSQDRKVARILLGTSGQATLAAQLLHGMLTEDPAMQKVLVASKQTTDTMMKKYTNFLSPSEE